MDLLRGVWRLAGCGVLLVAGVARCAFRFPFLSPEQRLHETGRWCALMAHALGLRVTSRGSVPKGASLLVANHISWLDILAINAVLPARFVSKADVHGWPLLGWLAANGGTLFIERERKRDAMRVVHQVAQALGDGGIVAVFPEGTTGDGRSLLGFHANLLQAAIATGTPLQPIALGYTDATAQPSLAVVWVGDTTLITSLWRVVTARGLHVQVSLLPPIASSGTERRELCAQVRDAIADDLGFDRDALSGN